MSQGPRRIASRRRAGRLGLNLIGTLVLVVFAFPVYWMVSTAFKPEIDILRYDPKFLPSPVTLEHFTTALTKPGFPTYLRNSLLVTLSAVGLALAVALLAAFALARLRFRGRKGFLVMVLLVQMAPFEALLIPFFLTMRDLNLLNRLPALTITYFVFTLPFTIWMLRGFVAAVPAELEEAALLDGCSRPQAFLRVVFPLLAPGLVATSIYGFITAWNEFLFALVLMRDQAHQTLPLWLASFRTAFGNDWGGTMAASTLFTLPVLAFFLIVQRRMVAGLTAGAVKG